ncbi:MBOAT family O-acyltransferase [Hoylesella shahii]|uniref:MBOAT family O-acyltransferase n=1 Tax=Hoylesella shahii TaxID=228603 RepID=UPI0028EFEB7C|nr:MBOAT family O-acyltransferase [Hoylesella shahii]
MIFNTFQFLWAFPIIFFLVVLIGQRDKLGLRNRKIGNYVLLAVSYLLYMQWEPLYVLILLWVTFITYIGARFLEKTKNGRIAFILFLILALSPLFFYKYYDFVIIQLNSLFVSFREKTVLRGLNWALPLGISFYTLQSVGYLFDVYKQRIRAEKNWWDYMLFVSFFPQIASGPISKAKDLLPQIKADRQLNYAQIVDGLKWLLWGMFLKVVVADNLGLRNNLVFNDFQSHGGIELVLCMISYAFQIYCDFAGYSFMAMGVGKILGFELINNFNRPYFSQSVTEFWHRWHISLSLWLKDYVYITLGGNRCSKIRNYLNIMLTFLVSGIWHGANWTFIIWGGIHGVFQVFEKALGYNKRISVGMVKSLRILITFVLVTFAWVFFRMPTLNDAILFLGCLVEPGTVNIKEYVFPLALILIVFWKDFSDENQLKSLQLLDNKYKMVRWTIYYLLLFSICVSGVFGGLFIYSGF